jgi:hypothetical protein
MGSNLPTFLPMLPCFSFLFFFLVAILISEVNFIVILTLIFQMISMLNIFPCACCLGSLCIFFGEMSIQVLCSFLYRPLLFVVVKL